MFIKDVHSVFVFIFTETIPSNKLREMLAQWRYNVGHSGTNCTVNECQDSY